MGESFLPEPVLPAAREVGGGVVEADAAAAGAGLGPELDSGAAEVLDGAVDRQPAVRWIMSLHLSPTISPRRMPVWAARWSAG